MRTTHFNTLGEEVVTLVSKAVIQLVRKNGIGRLAKQLGYNQ